MNFPKKTKPIRKNYKPYYRDYCKGGRDYGSCTGSI